MGKGAATGSNIVGPPPTLLDPLPAVEPIYPWRKARPLFGDIGRTTAWRMIRAGTLPAPVRVSPGRVAWRHSDIVAWQLRRGMGAYTLNEMLTRRLRPASDVAKRWAADGAAAYDDERRLALAQAAPVIAAQIIKAFDAANGMSGGEAAFTKWAREHPEEMSAAARKIFRAPQG